MAEHMILPKQWSEYQKELAELRNRFTAPIVCMCGSTRFKQTWITENARLTLEGNIVLSVGMTAHADGLMQQLEANGSKTRLDDLHKRKIDLCDWVWVLDVGGYVGDSTRGEIAYAEKLSRPVRYLSKEYPEYIEPVKLSFDAYQVAAERTANRTTADTNEMRFANFGMGLAGEAGETCDYLKKVVFHGHALDVGKLKKELGDCLWYVATLATTAGISLSDVAAANIEKLKARYPDGFSVERSINRVDKEGPA